MTKTNARVLKNHTIKDQFIDRSGRIWSLQVRTYTGRIVIEFFGRGVRSYTQRWQMQDMANGPIAFVDKCWSEYARDNRINQ